ncbi:uncharacterized protein LOC132563316 [Ylistrum balloti]|uniref:uncharacterized protein LOC132563316 n=1 Tax=Ylistrum balloti TaxID=509963 RepID=UPI002905E359|nr:uncharacterized protein LOC132563316 [Ylistrum balloti]
MMKSINISSEAACDEVAEPLYTNIQSLTRSTPKISNISLLPMQSKKITEWGDKILPVVAVLLAVSCIALAVCTVILFMKLERVRSEVKDFTNTTNDRRICVKCADLNVSRFGPDEKIALNSLVVTFDDNGEEVCCAKNSIQTKALMELVYVNSKSSCVQGLNNTDAQCSGSLLSQPTAGLPSAHLLAGLQITGLHNDTNTAFVRNWRTNDVTSHLEGVRLTTDRLVIKDSGLYLVYSQIGFSGHVAASSLRSAILLYHSVYRYSAIYPNGGNQLLMQSVRTMILDPVKTHSDITSFMAAAIQLAVRDQIYIKVSNISLISGDEKASFLGVVKFE